MLSHVFHLLAGAIKKPISIAANVAKLSGKSITENLVAMLQYLQNNDTNPGRSMPNSSNMSKKLGMIKIGAATKQKNANKPRNALWIPSK